MSMKHKIISCGIGLLVIFPAYWTINAQDAAQPASAPIKEPTKVALVDVNSIFKQNETFKEEMAELKRNADDTDKKMKEGQTLLALSQNQLQGLTPGSPEYSELEKKIDRRKTEMTLESQTKRQEMLMREAKIYRQNYLAISDVVAKYADEHQIDMVVRFSGNPVDANSPADILAEINKPVVHYDRKLDITPAILKIMAEKKK